MTALPNPDRKPEWFFFCSNCGRSFDEAERRQEGQATVLVCECGRELSRVWPVDSPWYMTIERVEE